MEITPRQFFVQMAINILFSTNVKTDWDKMLKIVYFCTLVEILSQKKTLKWDSTREIAENWGRNNNKKLSGSQNKFHKIMDFICRRVPEPYSYVSTVLTAIITWFLQLIVS